MLLCATSYVFLRHKFGKMPVKVVKSVPSDFYSVEVTVQREKSAAV